MGRDELRTLPLWMRSLAMSSAILARGGGSSHPPPPVSSSSLSWPILPRNVPLKTDHRHSTLPPADHTTCPNQQQRVSPLTASMASRVDL